MWGWGLGQADGEDWEARTQHPGAANPCWFGKQPLLGMSSQGVRGDWCASEGIDNLERQQ